VDGLVILLSLAETSGLPIGEINQLIMRLFVPNDEDAFRFADRAADAGEFDPNLPPGYFLQGQLKSIIASIPSLVAAERA
jgi:hypothetical protein